MSVAHHVEIESIAAGGDGVGRSEGLVLFVPRTAPGDVVSADFRSRGRFARGTLRSVEKPSPLRVDPPCAHYTRDRCGGCQIQHLSYPAQLTQKQQIVRDAMIRIGKRNVELPDIAASPKQWGYRAKLTLAIRKIGSGRAAGLHRYDNPAEIFDLRECPISDARVVEAWMEIKQHLALLPADDPDLRGSVRVSAQGVAFVLLGGSAWTDLSRFAEAMQSLACIWWEPRNGSRRLVIDRRTSAEPLASFAQVNPAVAAELRSHIVKSANAALPASVIDAYAGSGEIAVALARGGVAVTAIELDRDASDWTRAHLPAGSRAVTARVEDCLDAEMPADVILLNPPRSGLDDAVPAMLENTAARPRKLIYTSCNPATLARDVARMPGYSIAALQSFDMFPQTAHVETVCELVPDAA